MVTPADKRARQRARRRRRASEESRPKPTIDAARIISRLPDMGPSETVQVWRNALRILNDPRRSADHVEARATVEGVETCWHARSQGSLEGWFRWPTTEAPGGDSSVDGSNWEPQSPLKVMGYTVGQHGEPTRFREAILTRAFEGVIPPMFAPPYMREWDEPSSPRRLQKMANVIASMAKNAKHRDDRSMASAIRDWERDLAFLHDAFYAGRFGFAWPEVGQGKPGKRLMGHRDELSVQTGAGWLEALIDEARRKGACTRWACTTCGAMSFRTALWSAARRANPAQPEIEIARMLAILGPNADRDALRLVICDLNAKVGPARMSDLALIFDGSDAGLEYRAMIAHSRAVAEERRARAEFESPAAAAQRRIEKRAARAEAHALRLEAKAARDRARLYGKRDPNGTDGEGS